jgi:hypothetical protein
MRRGVDRSATLLSMDGMVRGRQEGNCWHLHVGLHEYRNRDGQMRRRQRQSVAQDPEEVEFSRHAQDCSGVESRWLRGPEWRRDAGGARACLRSRGQAYRRPPWRFGRMALCHSQGKAVISRRPARTVPRASIWCWRTGDGRRSLDRRGKHLEIRRPSHRSPAMLKVARRTTWRNDSFGLAS